MNDTQRTLVPFNFDFDAPPHWSQGKPQKQLTFTLVKPTQVIIRARGSARRGEASDTVRLELRLSGGEFNRTLVGMGEYSSFGAISIQVATTLWLPPDTYTYEAGWTTSLGTVSDTILLENGVFPPGEPEFLVWEPINSVVDSNFQIKLYSKGATLFARIRFEMPRAIKMVGLSYAKVDLHGGYQDVRLAANHEGNTLYDRTLRFGESGDHVPAKHEKVLGIPALPKQATTKIVGVPSNNGGDIASFSLSVIGIAPV